MKKALFFAPFFERQTFKQLLIQHILGPAYVTMRNRQFVCSSCSTNRNFGKISRCVDFHAVLRQWPEWGLATKEGYLATRKHQKQAHKPSKMRLPPDIWWQNVLFYGLIDTRERVFRFFRDFYFENWYFTCLPWKERFRWLFLPCTASKRTLWCICCSHCTDMHVIQLQYKFEPPRNL